MKKFLFILMFLLAFLGFVTNSFAGGGSDSGSTAAPAGSQILGMYDIPMPEWVHIVPRETGETMFFVVTGGSDGSTARKETNAASRSRSEHSQYISGKTDVLIRNYAELSGIVGNTQELIDLREGIINRASGNSSGLRRSEHWISADGEYWGLFTYDKASFKSDITNEVNSYIRNSAAAAASIRADEFFQEMERVLQP